MSVLYLSQTHYFHVHNCPNCHLQYPTSMNKIFENTKCIGSRVIADRRQGKSCNWSLETFAKIYSSHYFLTTLLLFFFENVSPLISTNVRYQGRHCPTLTGMAKVETPVFCPFVMVFWPFSTIFCRILPIVSPVSEIFKTQGNCHTCHTGVLRPCKI